jgi:hypothetical protein
MMTVPYTTIAMSNCHEKNRVTKKNKKGSIKTTINQLNNDIQFFLVLKMLMREKASLSN